MNGWRPSHLTARQKEERRLVAARLFRAGRLTPSEIAQRLGVSRAAVSQWRRAWRTGGDRRLQRCYRALPVRVGVLVLQGRLELLELPALRLVGDVGHGEVRVAARRLRRRGFFRLG